jgi:hypothetical protein
MIRASQMRLQVRVQGRIDERWSEWLEGLSIAHTEEDETLLTGSVLDQSALYGLLSRLRDLGLSLLAVEVSDLAVEDEDPSDPQDRLDPQDRPEPATPMGLCCSE